MHQKTNAFSKVFNHKMGNFVHKSLCIMFLKPITFKLVRIHLTFCCELLQIWMWKKRTTNSDADLNPAIVSHVYMEKQFRKRTKHACLHKDGSTNMLSATIYPSESAIKMHVSPFSLLYTGSSNPI